MAAAPWVGWAGVPGVPGADVRAAEARATVARATVAGARAEAEAVWAVAAMAVIEEALAVKGGFSGRHMEGMTAARGAVAGGERGGAAGPGAVTVRARVKEAVAKVAKAASAAERGGAASTEGGW